MRVEVSRVAFVHESVLPEAVMTYWPTVEDGIYVDATVGGGGHSALLLERFPQARLVAIDQDPVALEAARKRLGVFGERVKFVEGNFRHLESLLDFVGVLSVHGVLFDLGVSSPQLDVAERGFSYQADAPLDMRMNPNSPVTAFRLLNMRPEAEIAEVLHKWGEERWARRIAHFVVEARRREPIRTTGQLVEVVKAAIPARARREGGHPARRTFQALRIWVNDELGALSEGLLSAFKVLAPGGRICAISFHSLEDRIVKQTFLGWQSAGQGQVLTKKPVVPTEAEVAENPRARSAKLRAFQKSG
ncbi:MAG: 16S rRNA (cytosine(1402)-N(4))-methyltransferase RsmH [Firmicutes bacterium]|nr:16S rRNA (cytosine(1402)-N(4))-methyltransferase RsmH [Bacillota bacterium]